ncbi:hypothetical protein [Gordonia rhizosphera]|uniref:hypothetical protein n=1 Tax=Gordonia rhizosphera TaxID=83341 RepID=UPI003571664C
MQMLPLLGVRAPDDETTAGAATLGEAPDRGDRDRYRRAVGPIMLLPNRSR